MHSHANAGSADANASATIINDLGGVGAVVETVTVTPAASSTTGQVTTTTGDAVTAPITSTFRPLSTVSAPATSIAAPSTTSADDSTTADATSEEGTEANSAANNAENAASSRVANSQQSARNLLGGSSAVAVSGIPNQAFTISLPGKTTYQSNGSTVSIDDFSHDAGATPSIDPSGQSVFNLGVTLSDQPISTPEATEISGADQGDSGTVIAEVTPNAENESAGSNDPQSQQPPTSTSPTPTATRSPFVDITVSYY